MFENWDDVSKYADIASNSYGTATRKMQAYTDSVDAAKNRMTNAVEELALKINQADTLKVFYNTLTAVIDNLTLFSALLAGIAFTSRTAAGVTYGAQAMGRISSRLVNMAGDLEIARLANQSDFLGKGKQTIANQIELTYLANIQRQYAHQLENQIASLTEEQQSIIIATQTRIRAMAAQDQTAVGEFILATLNNQLTEGRFASLSAEVKLAFAEQLLLVATTEEEKAALQRIVSSLGLTESEEDLAVAQKLLANRIKQNAGAYGVIGQEAAGAAGLLANALKNGKIAALSSTGQIAGMLVGGYAGGTLALSYLGKQLGDSTANMIGTIGGSMLGGSILKYAFGTIGKVLVGTLAPSLMTVGAPLLAAVIPIAGLLLAIKKNQEKKTLEEKSQAATKASDTYNRRKGLLPTTALYDKLSAGVGGLGQNLSLTEDEYNQFLDASNKLAEEFPELIVYTDEAGNKFLGLGNKVSSVADEINRLTKESLNAADNAFLDEDLLNALIKEYTNKTKSLKKLQELMNLNPDDFNKLKNGEEVFTSNSVKQALTEANVEYNENVETGYISLKDVNSIDNALADIEAKLKEIRSESIDTFLMMLRLNDSTSELMQNFSNNELSFLTSVLKEAKIDLDAENLEEILTGIAKDVALISSQVPEALSFARSRPEDYANIGAYDEAQKRAYKGLIDYYGNELTTNSLTDSDKAIIRGYGFDVTEDAQGRQTITSPETMLTNLIRAFGQSGIYSDTLSSYLASLTPQMATALSAMTGGYAESLYNKGGINELETGILQESGYGDSIYSKIDYRNTRARQRENFYALLSDRAAYNEQNSYWLKNNIDDSTINSFKRRYGVLVGEALSNASQEWSKALDSDLKPEELKEKYQEIMKNVFDTSDLLESNANIDVIKTQLADMFSGVDLGTDGLISSFSELKDVLDSVSASLNRLHEALQEQTNTGKLSLETVLDLLDTDEKYLNVLEVKNGNIRLVADAEKIMGQAYLDTAKAGLIEMQAKKIQRAADILQLIVSGQIVDANEDEIAAMKLAITADAAAATSKLKLAATTLKAAEAQVELNKAVTNRGYTNSSAIKSIAGTLNTVADSVKEIQANTDGIGGSVARKLGLGEIEKLKVEWTELTGIKFDEAFSTQMEYVYKTYNGQEVVSDHMLSTSEMFDKGIWGQGGYTKNAKYSVNAGYDLSGYNLLTGETGGFTAGFGGSGPEKKGSIALLQSMIDSDTLNNPSKFWKNYKYDSSGTGNGTMEDLLKAMEAVIDKEYEAMKAFDVTKLTGLLKETEYFEKKRGILNREREYYATQMVNGDLSLKERLEAEQKFIEVEKQLRNLDDEEVQDKIKILELLNEDKKILIEQYKVLVKTADTLEESLEYQKQLYEIRKQQLEDEMSIAQSQEKSIGERRKLLLKEIALEENRGRKGAQEAFEYLNSDKTGNRALDTVREEIKEAKSEWASATTQEERDAARAKAENARNLLGYATNPDGTGFESLEGDIETDKVRLAQLYHELLEMDREEIENNIKIYGYKNISLLLIYKQLNALEALAVTDEQIAEIENRKEENLKQQYQTTKGLLEFNNTRLKFERDYLNPYLNAKDYDKNMTQTKKNIKDVLEYAKGEYNRLWNNVYNANLLMGLSKEAAAKEADKNSDVQSALQDWMSAYQGMGDAIMEEVNAKLDHLTRQIDRIEKEKPQEWTSLNQIDKFATKTIQNYQNEMDILSTQLKDIEYLTDEQIKDMVDKYNDAYKAIHEMRIQALNDKISYQDTQMSAVEWSIQEQIKDLEFQKDLISEIYDEELKKLQDKEASYARTNELIELQNKLLDANKSKEKVYRQGIGWVEFMPISNYIG